MFLWLADAQSRADAGILLVNRELFAVGFFENFPFVGGWKPGVDQTEHAEPVRCGSCASHDPFGEKADASTQVGSFRS